MAEICFVPAMYIYIHYWTVGKFLVNICERRTEIVHLSNSFVDIVELRHFLRWTHCVVTVCFTIAIISPLSQIVQCEAQVQNVMTLSLQCSKRRQIDYIKLQ